MFRVLILLLTAVPLFAQDDGENKFAGTQSCRDCHEKFYQLWAPSHHGLAMQPFTPELAKKQLKAHDEDLVIKDYRYRFGCDETSGWVLEKGPDGEKKFPILHAMGGKNVFYFLTLLDRGKLQVLPLAYDLNDERWFDTAGSAVRHFPNLTDEALEWKHRAYTFNTSCHGCHVSQFSSNYDAAEDVYRTTWAEPGINCETCHGGAEEHVRVCMEAPCGEVPEDLKIIRGGYKFTHEQQNDSCSICHAKSSPLSVSFTPGDRLYDHFDLVTLESNDYYPDGRDLGENYTYTTWIMSPCVKAGDLDCMHCHTSSGRFRFAGEKANEACLPCHEERVENSAQHTRHPAGSEGDRCIACHMPMTGFARMRRSDHSMRPPVPLATIEFESPNACNLCHTETDAKWSDEWIRQWRDRDYQAPVLAQARLIDDARKEKWSRLDEMLAYLEDPGRDEVFANSLVRLLRANDSEKVWPVLRSELASDPSPLIRASVVGSLRLNLVRENVDALLAVIDDDFRLVRIRAAAALAAVPAEMMTKKQQEAFARAEAEFVESMKARPDQPESSHNLGNFYMDRGDYVRAVAYYEIAARLGPDLIQSLVNASMAYNAMRRNAEAEKALRRALEIEPEAVAPNVNLGLLLGEMGRREEATEIFRKVLEIDPRIAMAAFNLGVLVAEENIDEAIHYCGTAAALRPEDPKYAYTLAYYQAQSGDMHAAKDVLEALIKQHPRYVDAHLFLGDLLERSEEWAEAASVYRQALANEDLPQEKRSYLESKLRRIPESLR
jgi:tetratricopeptide (TPR) repeat protein